MLAIESNLFIAYHSAKSVCIRNCSGPYFPAFGLNREIYGVNLRIHSKCGKIRIRNTPNADTFLAARSILFVMLHFISLISDRFVEYISSGVFFRNYCISIGEIISLQLLERSRYNLFFKSQKHLLKIINSHIFSYFYSFMTKSSKQTWDWLWQQVSNIKEWQDLSCQQSKKLLIDKNKPTVNC